MAALGDIFKVENFQSYLGQVCLNVYYYRLEDTPAEGNPAQGLAGEFAESVIPYIKAVQSARVTHTALRVINLSGTEYYETSVGAVGDQGAGGVDGDMPSFVAWGFQLVRGSTVTRHGSKRIVGVVDGLVSGNSASLALGTITAVNNALKATLTAGLVDNFRPVIVKHPLLTPPYNPVYSYVADVVFKGVKTQNSRKAGYGI